MDKKEQAIANHKKGFNCCQAVVDVFAEELGFDRKQAFRMAEGFGLGMGAMESTCGALSAAIMLAGLKNSDGNFDDPKTKGSTYKLNRELAAKFQEKTGATVCKVLKGVETGEMLTSCPDCVRAGVEVTQEVLGL